MALIMDSRGNPEDLQRMYLPHFIVRNGVGLS